MDSSRVDITQKKRELLAELRSRHVYVLEKGSIEAYYPDGVTGVGKPSKAQSFCNLVTSADAVHGLCDSIDVDGQAVPEIRVILEGVFNG